MPIGVVTCQTRNFQTEYDTDFTHRHLFDQILKAFTIRASRTGTTKVTVYGVNPFDWPTQRYGAFPQSVLPFRAFGIFHHLVGKLV